ncbi:hypothetical protein [Cohnella rhizosphaerae]|uniref:Uncharacterized protein n=1 Tax=Cohnella rhizosphaerae TaxID=1457232 RepID=A0A9X4QSG8_9BACL|nr:hypothetical protein [Cohnella rhizosphaerae]MDG0809575.1 hypothetical protein [Cohnella rhizosphaerae]
MASATGIWLMTTAASACQPAVRQMPSANKPTARETQSENVAPPISDNSRNSAVSAARFHRMLI